MKLIVSTARTQQTRKSDFCFVPEGEPVTFGLACHSGRGAIDGGCGCQRCLIGVKNRKGTTTFEVTDRPGLDRGGLIALLRDSVMAAYGLPLREADLQAAREADELSRLAEAFPVGIVLEKRGRKLQTRGTGRP
jgi:hypothetical protein